MLVIRAFEETAGPYHGFGLKFERRISESTAKKHFGGSLPCGYERTVRQAPGEYGGLPHTLVLANVAGYYYLRSCGVPVAMWPKTFGVQCTCASRFRVRHGTGL